MLVIEGEPRGLRKHGFDWIPVMEPEMVQDDPKNPTRTPVRQIMGAIAQYEKSMIVLQLRASTTRKWGKEGCCEGRKPYGYYEGEQSILERMKALRAAGMAYDKIAEQKTAEGLKPRSGAKWHAGVVHRLLRAKR